MSDIDKKAENFLKESFQANPSYSFNNWVIMYDHSMTAHKYAMQIANSTSCDKQVVSLGAILHDIGKSYQVGEETLHKQHGELAWLVSKDFLNTLDLSNSQLNLLQSILSEESTSTEFNIIKDADIIAFFADKQLQKALKEWADKKELPNELQRKLDKQAQLKLSISKEIAVPLTQEMKDRWNLK